MIILKQLWQNLSILVVALQIIVAKTGFDLEEKILNKVWLIEQSMEKLRQLEP